MIPIPIRIRITRNAALVLATATATFIPAAAASAGGNDYAIAAAAQSQFVSPGGTATIDWRAWTNADAPASCDVSIDELGLSVFSGTIQPGVIAAGEVSTPVLERNAKFTFTLTCNGAAVARRAVNVKIR